VVWTELAIEVRPSQVERVGAALLRDCARGFSEIPVGRRRVLRAYVAPGRPARRTVGRLRRALRDLRPPGRITVRRVSDTLWRDAWKAQARPVRVGRITVLPSWWDGGAAEGHLVVRIDPGMAFGSGEHATTHLCLEAVDARVRTGHSVIDVGTGSGILAIAAARVGARRVIAIDNDPVAVAVARANVRTNRVGRWVAVRLACTLRGVRVRANLILANLTPETLQPILADAVRRLRPDGLLVGSGFGAGRVRGVARAMRAAGLEPIEVRRRCGWCAVHAVVAPCSRTPPGEP
jgi:ribosomal protein L11 methyltransferase